MSNWRPTTKAKRDLKTYFRLHEIGEKDCERAANVLIACTLIGYARDLLPAKSSAREALSEAFEHAFDDLYLTAGYLSRAYPDLPKDFLLDALELVPKF